MQRFVSSGLCSPGLQKPNMLSAGTWAWQRLWVPSRGPSLPRWPLFTFMHRGGRGELAGPKGGGPIHNPEPARQGKKFRARAQGKGHTGGNSVPGHSGCPSRYLQVGDSNPPRPETQDSGDFDSESPGTHYSVWPAGRQHLYQRQKCRVPGPTPDPLTQNLHVNSPGPP